MLPKLKTQLKKILIDFKVKTLKCIHWSCRISKYFLNFTQGDYCLCDCEVMLTIFDESIFVSFFLVVLVEITNQHDDQLIVLDGITRLLGTQVTSLEHTDLSSENTSKCDKVTKYISKF